MSSFGYMAMSLYDYASTWGGACSATPTATGYDFEACFNAFLLPGNLIANATAVLNMFCPNAAGGNSFQSGIGAVLIATYNISCASSSANQSLCSTLTTAVNSVASSDPNYTRIVATSFLQALAGGLPAGVVCP